MLESWIKFFKAHERILATVIILAVIAFLGNKYLDYSAQKADTRLQAANQTLAVQKEANEKLAAQNQQAQAQYQILLGQINAQNARLSAEMIQLSQTLAARQKQDQALPLPDLALRWQALLTLPANSITSTENGLQVSPDASRATVSSLESLPVIKQQLSDETQIASDKDKQIASLGGVVNGQNQQIAGLNSQLVDAGKACKAEVAVAKKSRWKYFRAGAVAGFVAGILTGHYL